MARLEAKTRRVTRWRKSDQKLRWCASVLWAIERPVPPGEALPAPRLAETGASVQTHDHQLRCGVKPHHVRQCLYFNYERDTLGKPSMSVTARLLSWLSGMCLALGLFKSAGALLRWDAYDYGPPRVQYLMTALVFCVVWLALRIWLRRGRVRNSVANSAMLVSLVMLMASAFRAGVAQTADGGYRLSMRSDLRNLVMSQEDFYRDSGRYSPTPPPSFVTSRGVNAPSVALTPDGWTASITHTISRRTCVIYVGRARIAPAANEGEPACAPPPFDPRSLLVIGALLGTAGLLGGLARLRDRRS